MQTLAPCPSSWEAEYLHWKMGKAFAHRALIEILPLLLCSIVTLSKLVSLHQFHIYIYKVSTLTIALKNLKETIFFHFTYHNSLKRGNM